MREVCRSILGTFPVPPSSRLVFWLVDGKLLEIGLGSFQAKTQLLYPLLGSIRPAGRFLTHDTWKNWSLTWKLPPSNSATFPCRESIILKNKSCLYSSFNSMHSCIARAWRRLVPYWHSLWLPYCSLGNVGHRWMRPTENKYSMPWVLEIQYESRQI